MTEYSKSQVLSAYRDMTLDGLEARLAEKFARAKTTGLKMNIGALHRRFHHYWQNAAMGNKIEVLRLIAQLGGFVTR